MCFENGRKLQFLVSVLNVLEGEKQQIIRAQHSSLLICGAEVKEGTDDLIHE